ncbi:uncharacterized protein MELLADRAFT_96243 [Melampsora larici-populina 98AG31]|uniref:Uncharacterized protein n=1 Tax=Melampsora larici-populina (strain 98AG31 / pathotype 3-4-7) TaxID=747676 RepID=F4SBG0_MELLP|nr:uncharacterized protein MELLADRAFT_96243 [Melampsora larici-populina 98AG31]EGF98023.1 hypothetical protein MELLADRAFT_96243 [Melampsora larici-populina 98AG31]
MSRGSQSSVFSTQNATHPTDSAGNAGFRCFESDVIINSGALQSVTILIAGGQHNTTLTANRTYRIDGEVAAGGSNSVSVLFEDSALTINLAIPQVPPFSLSNKVSVYGVGMIAHWSTRPCHGDGRRAEVVRLLHRSSTANPVEFHADYVLSSRITSTLSLNALSVGNIISLRGYVIGHNLESNTWEIGVSAIQFMHCTPQLRRSRRQRGYAPISMDQLLR